jgi:prepilin-type N-terminal cleavage/methylation domain-containing protein/prepilin-type processing-associated H-X9-DG protein
MSSIKTPPGTHPISRSGFSIVELLVVISIIALIISILLPSLHASRQAAQSTRCLANQRQLATPIAMYCDSNREWLPTSGYSNTPAVAPNAPSWPGISANIMGVKYITEYSANAAAFGQIQNTGTLARKNGIFQCPSDNIPGLWGANLASTSYGWNDSQFGLGRNDVFTISLPFPTSGLGRTRRTSIKTPSNILMLGDMTRAALATGNGQICDYQHAQLDTTANLLKTILHNDYINILWSDGHASTRLKTSILSTEFDRRN